MAGQTHINRGVTLVELDATTCKTRYRQRFDTHASADDRAQLLGTLERATVGTIIIGVTADSAEHDGALRGIAGSFFKKYNMNLTGLVSRGKFAFIMQKGYPKKTIFQINGRYGRSTVIHAALLGKLGNQSQSSFLKAIVNFGISNALL